MIRLTMKNATHSFQHHFSELLGEFSALEFIHCINKPLLGIVQVDRYAMLADFLWV